MVSVSVGVEATVCTNESNAFHLDGEGKAFKEYGVAPVCKRILLNEAEVGPAFHASMRLLLHILRNWF